MKSTQYPTDREFNEFMLKKAEAEKVKAIKLNKKAAGWQAANKNEVSCEMCLHFMVILSIGKCTRWNFNTYVSYTCLQASHKMEG